MKARKTGWAIVTGAGSGLGRALALDLVERGIQVLAVGRRQDALQETQNRAQAFIGTVSADIATETGRAAIVAAVESLQPLRYLIHNAAVLEPIGPLSDIKLAQWRLQQATNVEGPLFLTQALLPHLAADARILHVSSGAAHRGLPGWGGYCTSKAGLFMLYQCLREELSPLGFHVGSVRPGVMDTPMQARIRESDESRFPGVERFRRLKAEGQLQPPERVADFLSWILLETGNRQFSEEEWDIDNEAQTRLWQDTRAM
ncbi:short-chain dehydrogenase [Ectothiorhodospira shaposhnikovii]|uniref:SDR family NAD(P)-dependent oxidoreductase n=1 Tax=Ectothiorhodospira shaposhnikovii TaxID=1054 RepID=UPI0019044014|nr:SDR family NAD(P)-dependent oxidoreductase [Ectothiorhodospira shaposhnikovii]MBK1674208.1 short-chain dehydrogenase [Ectothiorhodospira shaposhnikovii]